MILIWGWGNYNRRRRWSTPGQCESCGTEGLLASYDSLRCFSLFYVPVLPLGSVHVWDECPRCRVGKAMALGRWRRAKHETLPPILEAFERAPHDRELATNALGTAIQFQDPEILQEIAPRIRERHSGDEEMMGWLAQAESQFLPDDPEARPVVSRKLLPLLLLPAILVGLLGWYVSRGFSARIAHAYVVNGLNVPYDVLVNGDRVSVPAGGRRELRVGFGAVTVEPDLGQGGKHLGRGHQVLPVLVPHAGEPPLRPRGQRLQLDERVCHCLGTVIWGSSRKEYESSRNGATRSRRSSPRPRRSAAGPRGSLCGSRRRP